MTSGAMRRTFAKMVRRQAARAGTKGLGLLSRNTDVADRGRLRSHVLLRQATGGNPRSSPLEIGVVKRKEIRRSRRERTTRVAEERLTLSESIRGTSPTQ